MVDEEVSTSPRVKRGFFNSGLNLRAEGDENLGIGIKPRTNFADILRAIRGRRIAVTPSVSLF